MLTRTFLAASLAACSALTVLAQEPAESQEPPLFAAQAAALLPSSAPPAAQSAAFTPAIVSSCWNCSALSASTGNLYFTSNTIDEFNGTSAAVWRTGKTSLPGSEQVLYEETGDLSVSRHSFGSLVYANPGAFFGYFVANSVGPGAKFSQIKRVPLTGGPAIVMATSPAFIGGRELVTDGATLYWGDAGGIRSMPIGGGTVRTLVSTPSVNHVAFDGRFVYYTEGTHISRVPKAGGPATLLFVAASTVSALYVVDQGSSAELFWGEEGGAVRSMATTSSTPWTWQAPIAGRRTSSVGFDGTFVIWIDCSAPGNSYCTLKMATLSTRITLGEAGVGARNLQWDARNVFWTDVSSVKRYSH